MSGSMTSIEVYPALLASPDLVPGPDTVVLPFHPTFSLTTTCHSLGHVTTLCGNSTSVSSSRGRRRLAFASQSRQWYFKAEHIRAAFVCRTTNSSDASEHGRELSQSC